MRDNREYLLKVYEHEIESEIAPAERLFKIVALCSCALFGAIGLYLRTHNPPEQIMEERASRGRQVSFIIEEKKKPELSAIARPAAKPRPELPKAEEKRPVPEKPADLTQKPVLNQKIEDTKPDNSQAKTNEETRRVYGLRKVYSTGLGEGGTAADAVVGKLGNTLAADIDTVTATPKDLAGRIAPITRIQTLPRLKAPFKPEYTQAMIDNEVQGVIKANLLVDVDGRVKKAVVLNDLGFGSKQQVYQACLKLEFEPAKADGRPVAVWYEMSFRFELVD